jgi:hypothetical protein
MAATRSTEAGPRTFSQAQPDTNKIDVFAFCSTAAATLPKNSASPGRRFIPITMRLQRLRLASLRMTSSGAHSQGGTHFRVVPLPGRREILKDRFLASTGWRGSFVGASRADRIVTARNMERSDQHIVRLRQRDHDLCHSTRHFGTICGNQYAEFASRQVFRWSPLDRHL